MEMASPKCTVALVSFFTAGSDMCTWKGKESYKQASNGSFGVHQRFYLVTFFSITTVVRHSVTRVTRLFTAYSLRTTHSPCHYCKITVKSLLTILLLQSGWELSGSRLCRRCRVHMECEFWNAGKTASWHAQVTKHDIYWNLHFSTLQKECNIVI